ncbi:uncharacterized protein [Dermacentor albipictus]|uniref:uncharacterized protein n=1 Tax=Dermacentor albipictus TaxID=60249 RepID=UPI0038FC649C
MSKELAKMKDELKSDFAKVRDEMRHELKLFREGLERDLRTENREFKNEQNNMAKSLEFAFHEINELKTKLVECTAKNAKLESENAALHAKCSFLENTVQSLENRLVQTEQYSRKTNLEIQGVVKTENECLSDLLSKLGSTINEPIAASDLETCHRVPTRSGDRTNIIVQFKSRAKRDSVFHKARKMRLTNTDLGLEGSSSVYVNEHLCPALKKLLAMAVKRKHAHHWKSVWSLNGKIFARRAEDTPVLHIRNESDVEKITSGQAQV